MAESTVGFHTTDQVLRMLTRIRADNREQSPFPNVFRLRCGMLPLATSRAPTPATCAQHSAGLLIIDAACLCMSTKR